RHDVRIVALDRVDARRRARSERARCEFVNGIRAGTLDLQELREMPIAGNEDDAFDPLRVQPFGERALLGRELVPSLEAVRPAPELASAGDDLDRTPRRAHERLLEPRELARAEHRLVGAV